MPDQEQAPVNGAVELDLAAVAASFPVIHVRFDPDALDVGKLGAGEWIDLHEALNVPMDRLTGWLNASAYNKARYYLACQWLVARRARPDLTWRDFQRAMPPELLQQAVDQATTAAPKPRDPSRRGSRSKTTGT